MSTPLEKVNEVNKLRVVEQVLAGAIPDGRVL
jgi:hypothetical protein